MGIVLLQLQMLLLTVTPVCDVVANNTTSTANITEGQTKTLTATPAGGTWSIVSGRRLYLLDLLTRLLISILILL